MKKVIAWLTLLCFVTTQSAAVAGPADEGLAAGQAANPVIRSNIDTAHASTNVPGYTTTPPETSYYGQSNLTNQANAHLANCALTPNDPVCEAQRGAVASANMPRPTLTATDPAIAQVKGIVASPSTELGSLAPYYAGCATPGTCPTNVFCLGNTCFNTAYTNDTDFARSMTYMEAAREAGVYLDTTKMTVFNGEADSCRDRLLKNCCYADAAGAGMTNQSVSGVGSRLVYDILMNSDNQEFIVQGMSALLTSGGFSGSFTTYGVTFAVNGSALPAGSVTIASGNSFAIAFDPWSLAIAVVIYIVMSMSSCNANEGKLAMQEGARLCHTIGSWCSSCLMVLGHCASCTEHSTGKCCFNSQLARLINEQGRTQIGKGWGTAQQPDCSGFTIPQLQSLDFAKMDLTEFYPSIVPTMPNVAAIQAANATLPPAPIPGVPPTLPTPPQTPSPAPSPGPSPVPVGPAINAANCSYAAVRSAVMAAAAGTTVVIPAGDCDWGTQQLTVPAGIYLHGAGMNATTIRRNGFVSETAYLIAFDCSNGLRASLSDMSMIGNGNGAIWDKGLGLLNGCRDFRVFNARFSNFIFSAVYVGDAPNQRGVIYSNNFINNYSAALHNLGYGVVVYGGGAWPALDLGSPNAVFVEDNYFSGNRHNIASNNGSVYVFRHNTVIGQDPAKDFAMTDAHGLSSSPRGSRSYEVYNNTYSTNISSGLQRTAVGIRGGDGVIFNNTMALTISRAIELIPEGFSCGDYPGLDQIRSLYIWNNTNTSANGYTTNGIDNNCPASIGLNRDYFLAPRPGYTPYTYPHPLRAGP
jgi:hypothetical protein